MAQSLPAWREPEAVLRWRGSPSPSATGVRREDIAAAAGAAARRRSGGVLRHAADRRLVLGRSAARVAEGRPIRYLVPDAVAEAIAARGLYRTAAGRPAA